MSNSGIRNCLMVMTDKIDIEDRDRGCPDTVTNLDFRQDMVDPVRATAPDSRLDTVDPVRATAPDFHLDTADLVRATNREDHLDTADLVKATNREDLRDNNMATRHQHHHRQTWRRRTRVLSCSQ